MANRAAAASPAKTVPDASYTLADMAYQTILSEVISGHYPVNSRLPSEAKLASEIGLSRPILRIALARLKADGVLASRQGSGNFVIRQPHQTVLSFTPLGALSDVQDCFKFRVGVEGEAAYYAALNYDDAGRQGIDVAFADLETVARHGDVGVEADVDFHIQIAAASGNPYFVSALQAIRDQIVFGMGLTRRLSLRRSTERLRQVDAEHDEIRSLILARDAENARTSMRDHLESARRRLYEGDLEEGAHATAGDELASS